MIAQEIVYHKYTLEAKGIMKLNEELKKYRNIFKTHANANTNKNLQIPVDKVLNYKDFLQSKRENQSS